MEEEGEGHACVRRGLWRGESAWLGEAGGAERSTWEGMGNGKKREWMGSVWVVGLVGLCGWVWMGVGGVGDATSTRIENRVPTYA